MHKKARIQQLLLRKALRREPVFQRVPRGGGKADAKAFDRLAGEPAPCQVRPPGRAVGPEQRLHIKTGGLAARGVQALLVGALALQCGVARVVGQLHARARGQELDRLHKAQPLHLHDELDRRAARMAAEAVEHLLVRRNGERGRLFAMQRAQPPQAAALGAQLHIRRDDGNDVVLCQQLVQPRVRERHAARLLSARRPPGGRFPRFWPYQGLL